MNGTAPNTLIATKTTVKSRCTRGACNAPCMGVSDGLYFEIEGSAYRGLASLDAASKDEPGFGCDESLRPVTHGGPAPRCSAVQRYGGAGRGGGREEDRRARKAQIEGMRKLIVMKYM